MRLPLKILALVASLALGPSIAAAKVDSAKLNGANRATAAFLDQYKGPIASGNPPRQSDPKAKALLDKILDAETLGREILAMSELVKVQQLVNNGIKIFSVYTSRQGDAKSAAQTDEAAERQVVEFGAEIGRCVDFLMKAQGAIADSVSSWLASPSPQVQERPDVKNELPKVQDRMFEGTKGVLIIVGTYPNDDSRTAWQLARLAVLNDFAPKAATALPYAKTLALRVMARKFKSSTTDPTVQGALETFAVAIAKRDLRNERKAP